ncbi:MAG: hypothetical protein HYU27_03035, partial [Acidobacteria bacterium]|nr:hypothetical protein [Acidobacteriota bacterium]
MKVLALGIAFVLLVTISGSAQQQGSNDPIHFVGNYIEVVGIGRPPDNEKGPGGYGPARRAAARSWRRSTAVILARVTGVVVA